MNRLKKAAPVDTNLSSAKTRRGTEGSHTKIPETSPKQATTEEDARMPPHEKARVTGSPGKTGNDRRTVGIEVDKEESSPFQGVNLNKKFHRGGPQDQPLALEGLRFSSTGIFPDIADGSDPQLGLASDLYKGENALKRLMISYGGKYSGFVTKQTNFVSSAANQARSFSTKLRNLWWILSCTLLSQG